MLATLNWDAGWDIEHELCIKLRWTEYDTAKFRTVQPDRISREWACTEAPGEVQASGYGENTHRKEWLLSASRYDNMTVFSNVYTTLG